MSDPSKKTNPNGRRTLQSALKRTVGIENESAKEKVVRKEKKTKKSNEVERTRKCQKNFQLEITMRQHSNAKIRKDRKPYNVGETLDKAKQNRETDLGQSV